MKLFKMSTKKTPNMLPLLNSKGVTIGWEPAPTSKGPKKPSGFCAFSPSGLTPTPVRTRRNTGPEKDPEPKVVRSRRNTGSEKDPDKVTEADSEEENEKLKKEPCQRCSIKSINIVKCNDCAKWYCIKCEKVSTAMYNALAKHSRLHFTCTSCEEAPEPQIATAQEISTENLEEKIQRMMKATMEDMMSQMKEVVDQGKSHLRQSYADVTRVTGTITTMADTRPPVDATAAQTSVHRAEIIEKVDEYVDRERRKLNLIVHNIAESDAATQADRGKKDMEVFSGILRDEFKLKIKVANAIRLGRKFGPKNRLMLVTLE